MQSSWFWDCSYVPQHCYCEFYHDCQYSAPSLQNCQNWGLYGTKDQTASCLADCRIVCPRNQAFVAYLFLVHHHICMKESEIPCHYYLLSAFLTFSDNYHYHGEEFGSISLVLYFFIMRRWNDCSQGLLAVIFVCNCQLHSPSCTVPLLHLYILHYHYHQADSMAQRLPLIDLHSSYFRKATLSFALQMCSLSCHGGFGMFLLGSFHHGKSHVEKIYSKGASSREVFQYH